MLVRVKAASLKNVDKMMASGSHYDRLPDLPCVCGVDGVGLLDDGTRVYCGGARPPFGMMAERTVVSRAWCLPVPEQVDDVTAAALPNPALSAWLSLVWRAQLRPAEMVLILGATGVAGQLAVQIAKHLGAERVVAAGRNRRVLTTLRDLGADATIALESFGSRADRRFYPRGRPQGVRRCSRLRVGSSDGSPARGPHSS